MDSIHTKGTSFVDNYGRERIFNGINIVDKGSIFLNENIYNYFWNEEDVINIKNLGFNVIRLGFTWDAVEPEMGVYNEKYLDKLAEIISLCEKHEIYVYLDCHQDLYANNFCYGDGAPKWAVLNDGEKWSKPVGIWAEGYFYSKAVMNCFENFWQNKEVNGKGLLDRYADMWQHVAKRFANCPNLIGFDILNEPYPGKDGIKIFTTIIEAAVKLTSEDAGYTYKSLDLLKHFKKGTNAEFLTMIAKVCGRLKSKKMLSLFLKRFNNEKGFHEIVTTATPYIKKFDEEYYTPFMNKVSKSIREVTDNGIIFMENSYFSNLGIPYSAEPVTINGKREEKLAFAPHGYDIFVDSPLYNFSNNERAISIFKEHKNSQNRLNMPVLVGEFGGFASGTNWLHHIDFIFDYFNSNKWSCTYWHYDKLLLTPDKKHHFSRPYPQAVCGKIDFFGYDRFSKVFSMNFECDKDYKETKTIVYLHEKVKDIICDCSYNLSSLSETTSKLFIDSPLGKHRLQVQFE